MRHRRLVATLALLACALAGPAIAQQAAPAGYPAVPLLSTGTTILGETIRYPAGNAHVTAAIVTLAPGQRTILHEHKVPLFAYILEGEMTVDYGSRGTRVYHPGQSFIEAMEAPHFGINNSDKPMRLLGVYMGATGVADVTPVK
jgi:quercetin dioxygenase-like cupin family protein